MAVALATFVKLLALSLIIERALHFIFHFHLFQKFFEKRKNLKALIALIVSFILCAVYEFDAVELLLNEGAEQNQNLMKHLLGIAVTSLTLAGGSAGIVRCMDFFKKSFYDKA